MKEAISSRSPRGDRGKQIFESLDGRCSDFESVIRSYSKLSLDRQREFSRLLFENQVLDVKGLSEILKCSPRHIRSLVSEDRIPYSSVGHLVRFLPDRIHEWLLKGGTR